MMPKLPLLINNNFQKSKDIFESEKKKIINLLNDFDISVEHIGSTAIKNTIGKGIIDLVIACDNESDQKKIREILATQYRQGELNKKPDGRLFFCNNPGQTKAGDIHLHLVIKNSSNHLEVINFRNYLQNHPQEVEWYNQKKKDLAKETNNDRKEYVVKKGVFVQELLRKIKKA